MVVEANNNHTYLSVPRRSSRRTSFPTLQGLYVSLFEEELTSDNLDLAIYNKNANKELSPKILNITFILTVFISIVLCLDHGFVACNLEYIEKSFGVGYAQSSFIGSMVYMGFLIGCLLTGLFLPVLKSKILLIGSLISVVISGIYSSKSSTLAEIYASRFFIGFFQAFSIVYLPLWVEKFSPPSSTNTWLAYQQLFSMVGIFLGYLLGGILTSTAIEEINIYNMSFGQQLSSLFISWRGPFIIQSALIVPIIIVLIFIPSGALDVGDQEQLSEAEYSKTTGLLVSGVDLRRSTNINILSDSLVNKRSSKLRRSSILLIPSQSGSSNSKNLEIREICTNPIFILTTFAVCGIYCFTTCTLFWLNQYFADVIKVDKTTSVFSVACIYLSGPTMGVYIGGIIGDFVNDRHPNGFGFILTICTTLSLLGFIASMLVAHTRSYIGFFWGIIIILFFLTSTLPMSLIVIMKSVASKRRQLASAIAQFSFNLVGFLLSPVLIGIIMDIIEYFPFGALKRRYNPIEVGVKIMLYISLPIFFFYSLATLCSYFNCLVSSEPAQKKIIISNQIDVPKQLFIK
ncbi:putative dynactin subunit p62 [Cryptosporidium canis]|uniref:Dynactin subunit p62 n=1 Tax=Cryptosporidium canis TaxID=195482 RepID=A0ABQ8P7B3_9CRYT|nr:putative dynactin subunit p62 [Cryptosporidium canis]KAJ1614070.1 putative dynactin subunit p62 [Cryptosporidium canis]